jgi:hypothetical protein
MKLGEFIKQFSHNNLIRLWYKNEGGYKAVLAHANDVSMDWEVNKQEGKFRHYINNEVIGLVGIEFSNEIKHHDAINIIIEQLENQPYLEDLRAYNNLPQYEAI